MVGVMAAVSREVMAGQAARPAQATIVERADELVLRLSGDWVIS